MIKRLFLLTIMALSLPGCIATAILAGAAVGGLVVSDNRGMSARLDDQNIAYQAETNINDDPQLKDKTRISVVSFNRNLLLVGQAPNAELKERAGQVAYKDNQKIKRLYNQITVSEPISSVIASNDTYITSKVKADMLAEKGLSSTQIKVITEDSVVYLMGLVSKDQSELAARVASHVSGVKMVIKIFDYKND